jgi:heme/copper-type cytochrome/quinol oxidase subunit 2
MDAAATAAVPDAALWTLLGAVVFPVWLAAGLLDYAIHARQRIEHTAGPYESALHLLQALQVGVPVLIVLFLEVTATSAMAILAAVLAHAWTSWRDACYATSVRPIGPAEQKAHAVLDMVPWIGLALLALIHREALAPMLGPGSADWSLRLRDAPFPPSVVAAVLVSSVGAGVVPALLELRRGRRALPARQDAGTGPAS